MPRRVDETLVRAVGARIRSRRDALGLTQEELADRAGVHSETLSRVERGRMQPTLTLLMAVAEALGESAANLLGEAVPGLSTDEVELVDRYRHLDADARLLVQGLLERLR